MTKVSNRNKMINSADSTIPPMASCLSPRSTMDVSRRSLMSKSGSSRSLKKTQSRRKLGLSSKSKSKRGRLVNNKSVGFHEWVAIHQSTDGPITEEEKEAAWYTQDDFGSFEEQEKKLVRMYRRLTKKGNTDELKKDEYCVRGLDNVLTVQTSLATRDRYWECLDAVFQEQDVQRNSGLYDPVMIRKRSLIVTKLSKLIANNLGDADARAVNARPAGLMKRSSSRRLCLKTKQSGKRLDRQLMRRSGSLKNVNSVKVDQQLQNICIFPN
jgi:hypothetical protein